MSRLNSLLVLSLSIVLLASSAPAADNAPSLDALLGQIKTYKLGDSRAPMEQVGQIVLKSQLDAQRRATVASKLAAVLATDASFECKDFICRQLYIIGTKAEIPAVAKLLPDEKLSHMARYVLEAMADPDADSAMRQGIASTQGKIRIGIVNSLGNRRDAQSVPAFIRMLNGNDPALAAAAASALGKTGGPEAIKALAGYKSAQGEVREAMLDGYLACADAMLKANNAAAAGPMYEELYAQDQPARIRSAALRGLVAARLNKTIPILMAMLKSESPAQQALAANYAKQLPGEGATSALAGALSEISPTAQVFVIDALATRGGSTAKAAILAAAKSQEDSVRATAIKALAQVGDASDIAFLAQTAAKPAGQDRDAARESLARIKGANIDEAIVAAIPAASATVRGELIRALWARGASAVAPKLLDLAANDGSETVRKEAINALGTLATQKDLPAMVQCVLGAKTDSERDAARSAVGALCSRIADKDQCAAAVTGPLANASPPAKVALLATLSRIGGNKALAVVRESLKDADASVKEAAIRALTDWADASVTPDLLTIAGSQNQTHKVLALRGLVRILSQPGTKAADAINTYKAMLQVCTRPEDTKLVLGGLSNIKSAAALDLVLPMLDNQALKNEAATAIIKIAEAVGPARAAAKSALNKVIASSVDQAVKQKAQQTLSKGG